MNRICLIVVIVAIFEVCDNFACHEICGDSILDFENIKFTNLQEQNYINLSSTITECFAKNISKFSNSTNNYNLIAYSLMFKNYTDNNKTFNKTLLTPKIRTFDYIWDLTTDRICTAEDQKLDGFLKQFPSLFQDNFDNLLRNKSLYMSLQNDTQFDTCFDRLLILLEKVTEDMHICDQLHVYKELSEKVIFHAESELQKKFKLQIAGKLKEINNFEIANIRLDPDDKNKKCDTFIALTKAQQKLSLNIEYLLWSQVGIEEKTHADAIWASHIQNKHLQRTVETQKLSVINQVRLCGGGELVKRSRWILEVHDYRKREYLIKNAFTHEYLFVTDIAIEYLATTRRAVFTYAISNNLGYSREIEKGVWILTPMDMEIKQFVIKNKHYGEYLATGAMQNFIFDKNDVFTSKYNATPPLHWTIGYLGF